jgi:hypothetical protein
MLAYEVNAVGPILVIKVKLNASFQFSLCCCGGINILLAVIAAPLLLESELVFFVSAHVAVTEGWWSL